jgi:hypothetical protein
LVVALGKVLVARSGKLPNVDEMRTISEAELTKRRERETAQAKRIIIVCMLVFMALPFLLVWLMGSVSF